MTPFAAGARNLTTTRKLIALKWAPAVVRQAFRRANDPLGPEECMWREVAARLTLDALGHTGLAQTDHRKAVRDARIWFTHSKDVCEVFDMAEVNSADVRRSVVNYAERCNG